MTEKKTIHDYAVEILRTWKNIHPSAKPYVEAMLELYDIHDHYLYDSADDIVRRFLINANTWRGDDARRVKKQLNLLLISQN